MNVHSAGVQITVGRVLRAMVLVFKCNVVNFSLIIQTKLSEIYYAKEIPIQSFLFVITP